MSYYFERSDDVIKNEKRRPNQFIIDKMSNESQMILDVGRGNGWLSEAIQSDNNHLVSSDIFFTNVKRLLNEQLHPDNFGVVADVSHIPFPERVT